MVKIREFTEDDQGSDLNTLRLIFSYQNHDIELISQQRVEMIPLPSDPIYPCKEETGFWYELKDSENRTLYRRIVQNPIKFAIEVRSDDPDHPLKWEKVSSSNGSFFLTVPDLKQGDTLVIFSSPFDLRKAFEPAKEIARFNLKQYPKGKEVE